MTLHLKPKKRFCSCDDCPSVLRMKQRAFESWNALPLPHHYELGRSYGMCEAVVDHILLKLRLYYQSNGYSLPFEDDKLSEWIAKEMPADPEKLNTPTGPDSYSIKTPHPCFCEEDGLT